jgi:hypothetical protein
MQCTDSERCPARENPEIPCWEVAEKIKSQQCILNICDDCIVRLVKTNDPKLSQAEHDNILQFRNNWETDNCPLCANNGHKKNS